MVRGRLGFGVRGIRGIGVLAWGTGGTRTGGMGEGALDAVGEVGDVGPEGDDLAGEGGMMEETGGNQRSQRGEDGSEALNEGFHGHETNVERCAPRVKEKKQTWSRKVMD